MASGVLHVGKTPIRVTLRVCRKAGRIDRLRRLAKVTP